MEWIIGITVVCVVLYLMSSGGSKATPIKRSKAPVVKDFIEDARIYTEEDAVYTIQQFILALCSQIRWSPVAVPLAACAPTLRTIWF